MKKVSVELPRSAVLWTFHNIQMQVPTELLRSSSSKDTFPRQPKSVGRTAKVRSFTVITFSPAGKMSVELPRSSSSVGLKKCVRRTAKVRSSMGTTFQTTEKCP